ncbi:MAG: hypothetical protein PHW89_07870 [Sulfurimonas denitrificans]|nr:hypothetical protein [Sulfurimonas denitrificans]
MAYSEKQWQEAKALFELGKSPQEIADKVGFKSRDTVNKKAIKENWEKNKILHQKAELIELEEKNSTIQEENSTMVEKLANLEDYQITILKETVESELKRKSILLSTANLSLIRKNQLLTKNKKTVIEMETIYSDEGKPLKKTPVEIEIELSPNDLKTLDEGIDKNAITLELAQRHASSQVNIQNTNAQQTKIDIDKDMILDTLKAFDDEY